MMTQPSSREVGVNLLHLHRPKLLISSRLRGPNVGVGSVDQL